MEMPFIQLKFCQFLGYGYHCFFSGHSSIEKSLCIPISFMATITVNLPLIMSSINQLIILLISSEYMSNMKIFG